MVQGIADKVLNSYYNLFDDNHKHFYNGSLKDAMHPKSLEEAGEIAAEIVLSGLKGFLKSPAGMLQAAIHPIDTIKNLPRALIEGIKQFYSTVAHPENHKLSDVAEAIGAALFPTPIEGLGGLAALVTTKAAGKVAAKAFTAGAKAAHLIKEAHPQAGITAQRAGEALQKLHDTAKLHSDKVLQDITQTLHGALQVKPSLALQTASKVGNMGGKETTHLFNEIPTDPTKEENNLNSTTGNTPNHEKSPHTLKEPHQEEHKGTKPQQAAHSVTEDYTQTQISPSMSKIEVKKGEPYIEINRNNSGLTYGNPLFYEPITKEMLNSLPSYMKDGIESMKKEYKEEKAKIRHHNLNNKEKQNENIVLSLIYVPGEKPNVINKIKDYSQSLRARLAEAGKYLKYNPEEQTPIAAGIVEKNQENTRVFEEKKRKFEEENAPPEVIRELKCRKIPNHNIGTAHAEIGGLYQAYKAGLTQGKHIIILLKVTGKYANIA